ncbi:hypothetical protein AB0L68_26460 [Streptomyces sp. NPDC052164]|uniref:hypothetical protein n=1 Tax=Streptomyces sp. NPDC052164 TaxID=3155529 RepID=UPI0034143CEE
MTDFLRDRTESPPVDAAYAAAETAARTAGIDIRCLDSVGELEAVRRLYEQIWRTGENSPVVTADLLRALAKAGSYVSGAFVGDELVGSCFGFFSPPARAALHSHIAGVLPHVRRRNVGFALKLHQRAWTLARGVGEICWTYDPLVRRNAYFNIAKLAAEPAEYLPDFYGPIDDGINASDDSDRILVRWHLTSPDTESVCAGRPRPADAQAARSRGAAVALAASATGAPSTVRTGGNARTLLVAVPEDIEALRESDPVPTPRSIPRWRSSAPRSEPGGGPGRPPALVAATAGCAFADLPVAVTALTDVPLAIAVVGVADMWAQSGMRSVHTAWFAGMLCCYDLVATGLTSVMDRFAAQVVGLPFAPLPAVTQDGPPVALGLGDLLLLVLFPLVALKAFGRAAALLAAGVGLAVSASVSLLFGLGVLTGAFPPLTALGPLIVLQHVLRSRSGSASGPPSRSPGTAAPHTAPDGPAGSRGPAARRSIVHGARRHRADPPAAPAGTRSSGVAGGVA